MSERHKPVPLHTAIAVTAGITGLLLAAGGGLRDRTGRSAVAPAGSRVVTPADDLRTNTDGAAGPSRPGRGGARTSEEGRIWA